MREWQRRGLAAVATHLLGAADCSQSEQRQYDKFPHDPHLGELIFVIDPQVLHFTAISA